MKAKIFSFVRISDNSMVASVRIAKYLQNYLQCPLTFEEDVADEPLDVLYIINGAYGFCKVLPALAKAALAAKRIVWVQNDYSIIPPKTDSKGESPFRAAFRERHEQGKPDMVFWSTCEEWANKPHSIYVNWNMLTFDPAYDTVDFRKRRKNVGNTLFYYGSYRDGSGKSSRVPLFDRYFARPAVNTHISSPVDKFRERYPECSHVPAIKENFYETLGSYGLGLYVEDRKSSENFHSPANRFYEMLSAGLPMVFQPECGTMLRRASFDPTPWTVDNARSIVRHMDNREQIGKDQRAAWCGTDYRDVLQQQMQEAHRQLMESM